jgi:hypothetical protein
MTPREVVRQPVVLVVLIALAAVVVWLLWPDPEREIRIVIDRVESIVESLEIENLRPILSEEFVSPETGDKQETMDLLASVFNEILSVEVKIKEMLIDLEGGRATALVAFQVSGMIRGGDIYNQVPFRGISMAEPGTNPLERVRVRFVKDNDKWRIREVELLAPLAEGETL